MSASSFDDVVGAALIRAHHLIDIHRPDEALRMLAAALAEDPDNPDILCAAARASLDSSRYREAGEFATRAAAAAPHWELPFRVLAAALFCMGDPEKAASCARKAVALAPNEWLTHYVRALVCSTSRLSSQEAYAAARRAIHLAPNEADAWAVLGHVAVENRDQDIAQKALEKALSLEPTHSTARNDLGRLHLLRDDPVGAAGHFAGAVASDVRCREAVQNLESTVSEAFSDIIIVFGIVLALIEWTVIAVGAHPSASTRLVVGVFCLRIVGSLLIKQLMPLLRAPPGRYVFSLLRLYPELIAAAALQFTGFALLTAVWALPGRAWLWLTAIGTAALFGSVLLHVRHVRRRLST
ncbi:MAG: tetratricopeptide repeat protein [Mycolicibacterium rufum]|nr:tetratricopeptide repeat protein [Mycolicibacterium rufum]